MIVVDSVSKQYRLGAWSPTFLRGARAVLRRLRRLAPLPDDRFWALRDVSFTVEPAEVLGIIGPNGGGKTTILKLLAGVTKPSEGRVAVRGKVSALIELGAGFHPELSGTENVYLNGAILGMKRREMRELLDGIIEFSELESFMDMPVKRYSSGMYARLGFSVAVCVNPDILLVDEVLSVGDIAFQQKSLRRMLELKAQAKAMVFVSHNLAAVQQLCSRVLWLDHGEVVMAGGPDEVTERYRRKSAERSLVASRGKQGAPASGWRAIAKIAGVELVRSQAGSRATYRVGEDIQIRLSVSVLRPLTSLVCAVALYRHDGLKLGEANSLGDESGFGRERGRAQMTLDLSDPPLSPGTYYLNVAISDNCMVLCDHVRFAAHFTVEGTRVQSLVPGPLYLRGRWCYKGPTGSVSRDGDAPDGEWT